MEKKSQLVKTGRQRSFGRTSSRMNLSQQQKLDDKLEKLNLSQPFTQSGKLIVELGIGNGELLFHRAKENPNDRFIGVEVFKNGLRTLVNNIEKEKLTNARILNFDARDVLEKLEANSVDELIVLYPDPWPKARHKKRRIINQEFLELASHVIKEDGTLFLTTDIPDYAVWMLKEVYTHGEFFPSAISPDQWSKKPTWWHSTRYEQKAFKAGRKPWYMTFKRNVDRSNTKCERVDELPPQR